MRGTLAKAFGYQGNHMALPVPDLDAALPFYQRRLGFDVVSRSDTPARAAVLGRDQVQIGLAENGGDPSQDGCGFHVRNLEALRAELSANGLTTELSEVRTERHSSGEWKVFYVVAPDGLCYWFGEQAGS